MVRPNICRQMFLQETDVRSKTIGFGAIQRMINELKRSGSATTSKPSTIRSRPAPRNGTKTPSRLSKGNSMAIRIAVKVTPEARAASLVRIGTRRSRISAKPRRKFSQPRRWASPAAALCKARRTIKFATTVKDAGSGTRLQMGLLQVLVHPTDDLAQAVQA